MAESLLIGCLCYFCHYFAFVDEFLERQQYLVGVDGFDEIVGNVLSHSLVHDVLFLTLRYHDDGNGGLNLLDALQGFYSRQSGHHFVQQDQIEAPLTTFLNGVKAIGHRHHLIALLFQEKQMGAQ